MTTLTAEDRNFIIKEFRSTECACGKRKQSKRSFCYDCYTSLPAGMRQDMWKKFFNGYEEAYEDALKWLKHNVWD